MELGGEKRRFKGSTDICNFISSLTGDFKSP